MKDRIEETIKVLRLMRDTLQEGVTDAERFLMQAKKTRVTLERFEQSNPGQSNLQRYDDLIRNTENYMRRDAKLVEEIDLSIVEYEKMAEHKE